MSVATTRRESRPPRIIATQSDDDSKTNTITLDGPKEGTEDLLAQLGVSNTELGL